MKTDIIGHRGAAGLALENSKTAIQKALELGVPTLEIDARLTADGQLVLCHDPDLMRVAHDTRRIADCTAAELALVALNDGSKLLTLAEALQLVGNRSVIIELKDAGSAKPLLKVLRDFPKADVSVASFIREELVELKDHQPKRIYYALTRWRPLHTIWFSQHHALGGVGLFWGALHPLAYRMAQRRGLAIYTYTVNNRWVARWIRTHYPQVKVCTNRPDVLKR